MKRAATILLALFMLTAPHAVCIAETEAIDEQLAVIRSGLSVQIHYRYQPDLFFPPEWLNPRLELEAVEIEIEEVTRLLPVLQQFLDTHPVSVVSNNLEHIYLLKELRFQGKPYGSTHHKNNIYLVCGSIEERYDDEFLACRLHSEFSSILRTRHPFPSEGWERINPAGFTYSGTGFEVVDNPSCYDSTERSCGDGFLVNFCRSSLENDFGILSSWLFVRNEELNVLSQQHVRLRDKQTLAEQFFRSLSPDYIFN